MDFRTNFIKNKIEDLIQEKLLPLKASFVVSEKINQENIHTIGIDIDCENSIGLIILYEDGYISFYYIDKNDEKMKNESWSKKVNDIEEIFDDISDFLTNKIY